MKQELSVGIIGDFDPAKVSHVPTNEALKHAADRLDSGLTVTWLPTASLVPPEARVGFDRFDAIMEHLAAHTEAWKEHCLG